MIPPKKVVKDWKDIFPAEEKKPAVKRVGPISSRPAVAAKPADDDPWRVGNQHPRRKLDRLANGAPLAGFVYNNTPGSTGYDPQPLSENDYPMPSSTPAAPAPFEVRHVEGNRYRVYAGTCEGQLIETQEIDVGGTRPVAILAYPQYSLSIYNSEYVWAASVKTGSDAPVLITSTSTLGDVTVVSSSGDEARALIAYIDDAVYQITTGNIVSTFTDDGTLTGKMSGNFNKNS